MLCNILSTCSHTSITYKIERWNFHFSRLHGTATIDFNYRFLKIRSIPSFARFRTISGRLLTHEMLLSTPTFGSGSLPMYGLYPRGSVFTSITNGTSAWTTHLTLTLTTYNITTYYPQLLSGRFCALPVSTLSALFVILMFFISFFN